jgi:hypothetical protein
MSRSLAEANSGLAGHRLAVDRVADQPIVKPGNLVDVHRRISFRRERATAEVGTRVSKHLDADVGCRGL